MYFSLALSKVFDITSADQLATQGITRYIDIDLVSFPHIWLHMDGSKNKI